jgi:hypothetical protein
MPLTTANFTSNTIRRSTFSMRYNALGVVESISYIRSGLIRGLNSAGVLPGQAVIAALQLMQTIYPVGSEDANVPLAVARGYSTEEAEDDDSILGLIEFAYIQVPWDTTVWHIESDASGEAQETSVQYAEDGSFIPIRVANYNEYWKDTTDAIPSPVVLKEADFGSVVVPKSLKRWSFTRQIYSEAAAVAFDTASLAYNQCLNSVTFTGLMPGSGIVQGLSCPPGTVLCRSVNVSYDPFENRNLATVVLEYRPEGHQPYCAYRSPITGNIPSNTWRSTPPGTDGNGAGITFPGTAGASSYPANGVIRTTALLSADLNALLLLLTGTAPNPFPTG